MREWAVDARRVRAGRFARLSRDDDRRHAGRLRGRPHRPPQRAARLHGASSASRRSSSPRSNDVTTLGILRLLAGIGLGGAMPNAAALAAEYVPLRQRPFAVTLAIVCVPVGATLAGFAAIARAADASAGAGCSSSAARRRSSRRGCSRCVMPESPRYLVRHPSRWRELAALLRRMGHGVPRRRHASSQPPGSDRRPRLRWRRSSAASCESTPSGCGARSFPACSPSISVSRGCRRS